MADQDFEVATCPVCMEPPHNAVLIICTSHDNGCRPLLCDTGSNLSNCLSQFLSSSALPSCPLCRGQVSDYTEVEAAARSSMNAKSRSCPHESCEFTRNYTQLVQHASEVHPSVNPSEAGEERLQEWAMLEEVEREAELRAMGFPLLVAPSSVPISHLRVIRAEENLTLVVRGRETMRTRTQLPMTEEFARRVMAGRSLNWAQGIGATIFQAENAREAPSSMDWAQGIGATEDYFSSKECKSSSPFGGDPSRTKARGDLAHT